MIRTFDGILTIISALEYKFVCLSLWVFVFNMNIMLSERKQYLIHDYQRQKS